jgi:hypothetical protein
VGANDGSTKALVSLTTKLTSDREFPPASGMVIEHYRWNLIGETSRRVGRWFRRRTVDEGLEIGLNLADLGGENYDPRSPATAELIEDLVSSRGIVFLFDPVREFEEGDSFEYLFGVLSQLSQQMLNANKFEGGKLPHYLAVCITKFDEPRVLKSAEQLDLIDPDPDDKLGFPRVNSDDAKEFFEQLCAEISASGNAEMVGNTLEQYFRSERIRYFVTSAIGFHVDPYVGVYDPDDSQNLLPGSDGYIKIRGTARPINVMEPMLWLGRQLAPAGRD